MNGEVSTFNMLHLLPERRRKSWRLKKDNKFQWETKKRRNESRLRKKNNYAVIMGSVPKREKEKFIELSRCCKGRNEKNSLAQTIIKFLDVKRTRGSI